MVNPWLWIFTIIVSPVKAGLQGMENKLIAELMDNYNRNARPVADVLMPVHVQISFYMTKLMSLDERNQILTTFGWLEASWNDSNLVWVPENYGGLPRLVLPPYKVWLPDFGVVNSAKQIYDNLHFKRFNVDITHVGRVEWNLGGKIITTCELDITLYPFDTQECTIDFANWAYDGRQVLLTNGTPEIGLSSYNENGEWLILSTAVKAFNQYHFQPSSQAEVPYPTVKFELRLRRKPVFYVINVIMPCLLLSMLSVLVFYLPPESGEKISLGVTLLLSFSVTLLMIAENVPKTSDYVPLIGIYVTFIMSMTATSILISVGIMNIHAQDPNSRLPSWLRKLALCYIAKLLCMKPDASKMKGAYKVHHEEWKSPCQNSFKSHMSERERERLYEDYSESFVHTEVNGAIQMQPLNTENRTPSPFNEILMHIREINVRLKEDIDVEEIKAECKTVAKIIDRFALVLYFLLIIFSSLALLYAYPAWLGCFETS